MTEERRADRRRDAPGEKKREGRSRRARGAVAVRLARRQIRRTRGSSALVATLVALPIAGVVGLLVVAISVVGTPEQQIRSQLGGMAAWIQSAGPADAGMWQAPSQPQIIGFPVDSEGRELRPDAPPPADPTVFLPAGTETILVTEGSARVRTPDGIAALDAVVGTTWDPRFAGRYDLMSGTAPAADDEAMVSEAALRRIGATVGGRLTLADGTSYTVTGTLRARDRAPSLATVFLPPSDAARELAPIATGPFESTRWYLPELAPTWTDVVALNEHGVIAYSLPVVLDPPPVGTVQLQSAQSAYWAAMWTIISLAAAAAGFAAYVVMMLAGAAFAVAARRQQGALAVAASVGATRGDLALSVVLQGSLLGLAGGVIGIALGIGGAAIVRGTFLADALAEGLTIPWPAIAAVAAFAVLVGTGSAFLPARAVSRSDPLSALRGARRPVTAPRSRPVWGLVVLITGLGLTLAAAALLTVAVADPRIPSDSWLRSAPLIGIIVGPVLVQLGVVLAGAWLLGLAARGLSRLGPAARIAARDASSNAPRTVPAFAAIGATVFVAVFALATASMIAAQNARNHYFSAPVGSVVVSAEQTAPGPSDPARRRALAAESVELLRDAGAETVATDLRQEPVSYDSAGAAQVPEGAERAMAIVPERNLLDPTVQSSWSGPDPHDNITVVTPEDLPALLGPDLTPAQREAFADGAALVVDERYLDDGSVRIGTWRVQDVADGRVPDNVWLPFPEEPAAVAPLREQTLPAHRVARATGAVGVAISPATAVALGVTADTPRTVVGAFPEGISRATLDSLTAAADAASTAGLQLSVREETGPVSPLTWMVPLLGALAVLVIGASAVALGLARFERRPDDATLAAVGGTPGLRRRIAFWQAVLVTGFGVVAGAAAGILPPIGLAMQSQGTMRIADLPWLVIAATIVALTLLTAVVSALVPPRRPELVRRTAIT